MIARRQAVLDSARAARPERFVGGPGLQIVVRFRCAGSRAFALP